MTTLITFGCRLNGAESDAIAAHAGHLPDTIIVNTCAVTTAAERQARQAIRRAHREHPGAAIVVTGCAATIEPSAWAALPGVTRIVANADKLNPATWGSFPTRFVPRSRTRAFIDIQHGCDHHCTFCIIPRGRGPGRTLPPAEIVERVRRAVLEGAREVVLTGVDVTSCDPPLGTLVQAVLREVPDLPRLRLSSLDPAAIDPALWDALASEPRLMPHLHLSLQSASDLILKRMRRRHSRAAAHDVVRRARALRPGIAIGADLIAGFPTETDALFRETLDFIGEADLTYLHVFPFSARPGTPAARMPAVPPGEVRRRAARLREAGLSLAERFHRGLVGRTADVLVERGGTGHTEHFAPVRIDAPSGLVVRARLTGLADGRLQAQRTSPDRPGAH